MASGMKLLLDKIVTFYEFLERQNQTVNLNEFPPQYRHDYKFTDINKSCYFRHTR